MYEAKNWIKGLLFSFVLIWLLSYYFVDSVEDYEWDQDTESYVFRYGAIHRHRSEGWGNSYTGKHGINGIDDVTKLPQSKLLIWGDSYVEGWQVDDKYKMAQVLSDIFNEEGIKNTVAVSLGVSGDDAADYYFKIPRFEKKISLVNLHCIVFSDIKDFLPDVDLLRCSYQSMPTFQLVDSQWKPGMQTAKQIVSKFKMDFLWHITKTFILDKKIQFAINTPNNKQVNKAKITYDKVNALKFIIGKIRSQTQKDILLIYTPSAPSIINGALSFEDKDRKDIEQFRQLCFENGMDFLNMHNIFVEFYKETGKFPRGFMNSRPSLGHFNRDGHRLIARAIFVHRYSNN